MIKKLKLSALALTVAAAAVTAQAEDNLLQAVTVNFEFYTQGPPVVNSSGGTNYVAYKQGFGIKDLIKAITGSASASGDMLVRETPVTNTPIDVTNLVPVSTNYVVITNVSTIANVSNSLIIGPSFATLATGGDTSSNYIGSTNVTFGSNATVTVVNGASVTLGTNTVIIAATPTPITNIIGTNTTVTTTILTNAAGNNVGTSYAFVINALNITATTTNKTGTGTWAIYNSHAKTTTAIPTNVYFNIYTDTVFASPTNYAYVHGENIKKNGEIQFGTTDEIRTLVLSNSTTLIKVSGYAKGRLVPVSLGGTSVVYSQDYNWSGGGSGLISNTVPTVITGDILEGFYKLLK